MRHKHTHIYTLLLLLLPYFLFSQKEDEVLNKKFDSIFFDAATNVASSDIDRAHQIADSLYRFSRSDTHKIRALMLSSMFYQTSGNSEKTVRFALEAEKIAIKTKDYNWQARILGFLSTEFQNIGIFKEREEFIDRMGNTVPKIKDEYQRALMYPIYYQERALFYLENKNEEKVWEYINLAKKHLKELPDSPTKFMLLGLNERTHGDFFLSLDRHPDSALVHFDKSIYFYEKADNLGDYARDFLYSGMGQAYLMKKQDSLGIYYLKKAEYITMSSHNAPLRVQIYKIFSDYYKEKKDKDNYVLYLEQYRELHDSIQNQKIKPVELLLQNLKTKNKSLQYGQSSFLILSVVLLIAVIGGVLWYRKKKKQDYQRFKKIISELKQKGFVSTERLYVQGAFDEEPQPAEGSDKKEKLRISEETERKIIEGLKSFESGTNFLNANFALADLASQVGVNTKYLSHTLKRHYNKDFSTYINELRINYIIDKLQTHKEYHLYKLSFLAEECGFSSHSKFSAVFKSVTGLTPTKFINYLEQEKGLSA